MLVVEILIKREKEKREKKYLKNPKILNYLLA